MITLSSNLNISGSTKLPPAIAPPEAKNKDKALIFIKLSSSLARYLPFALVFLPRNHLTVDDVTLCISVTESVFSNSDLSILVSVCNLLKVPATKAPPTPIITKGKKYWIGNNSARIFN
ncbi:hypothetical protein OVS_01705 [Mycoplasma ovis str. Michigan]|uniref:Uncharacterized protein n=1 Tax=Mycoplasma ovis str. Michigan TaxID=1415773 RepID=A0ABN4BLF7_9MOLU|nr:hypothetical protein OVS_01705 [Mycoplasma ovis str. Michigan]